MRIAWVRRARLLMRRILLGSVIVLLILVVSGVGWFIASGGIGNYFASKRDSFYEFTAKRGLRVDEIFLEGQYFSDSEKILTALGVSRGDPILGIGLNEAKARLELVDWVKHAAVERQLPNALHVRIMENVPAALWQYDKKLYVIDADGEVIDDRNLKRFVGLPMLVGEDAPQNAGSLLSMFDQEEGLRNQIASAIRIGKRRWNVRTHSGVEIKLPEYEKEQAWKQLASLQQQSRILDGDVRIIDLRLTDRVAIQRK